MQTTYDFTDYFSTVTEWVARQPDQIALGYLEEGAGELTERAWTYAELVSHATAVAARLREDLEPGDRTLLLYPPGLPFVAAFLGCLAAGVVAVPAPLPDGRDKAQHRLAGIIADAGTRVVLTESSVAPLIAGWADALPTPIALIATDAIPVELGREFVPVRSAPSDTAFLQYTSGSTNAPKGVIVTHGNLVHNEQELGARIENDPSFSMLSWLPQFHDMGLIGMLLWPLFYGGTSRFLSPVTFIKHPIQWIRAMSKYRATVGVAPNFAFDLVARRCTHEALEGVDLSCVRSLLNGSEPVQWASIERFTTLLAPFGLAEHAVTPVYGLAEATLFVTGDPHGTPVTTAVVDGEALAENRLVVANEGAPRSRVLVASGRIGGIEVSVVGADGAPLPDGEIGEIWLRGTSVAAGYWNLPELSAEIFGATPIGGTGGWLRTGDLGTLVDGNLFITGRTKDVIIVNGRNLYAHDIEAAARAAAPALARGVGAAFAVGTPERLVLVHEIRPENLGDASLDDVLAAVRTAIFAEFATPLSDLVLVAKGEVARTTSGKIRRTHMRASYEGGPDHGVRGSAAGLRRRGRRPVTTSITLVAPRRFDIVDTVEAALGDARDPDNPAGFAVLAAQDRDDTFPADAIAILDRLRVAEHYVPVADGGRLADYLEVSQLIRVLARRSVTLAVAHAKTFLGAATAWIGARGEQRARLSELVRSGVPVSWGLTEREHGSDLLAGDVAVENGALSGAKWLINNATRGGAVVAIARTSVAGGPRGFDLVLVDKAALSARGAAPTYRHLPKELTHGIRGADISGIEFDGVPVDDTDVLSEPGRGLENVMKALQLTRTLCCSLSVGAAERGLHTAVSFAESRELYGRKLIELPQARRVLTDALADHLLNEVTTCAAIRSIHTLPAELSLHAAAAKYWVPTRTEALLAALRSFVGARAVLDSDDPTAPALSRIERDHRIVSLFDGNTVVNLTTLITQFPVIGRGDLPADSAALVAAAPDADLSRLSLMSRSGSTLLRTLGDAVIQLDGHDLPDGCRRTASALAAVARDIVRAAADAPRNPAETPNASFALAERLAAAIAGAAAVHVYLAYAGTIDSPLWRDGLWLRLALPRALAGADPAAPPSGPDGDHDAAIAALESLNRSDAGFSVLANVLDDETGDRV